MSCIPKEKAQQLKEKIERGELSAEEIVKLLPEEKMALKSLLEEVVSEELGIKISSDEVAEISKISKKIDEAQKKVGKDLGNPEKLQENIDFWKAKKEMDDYLAERNPTPIFRIATGTTGRAAMLFSVKSPILNIGSNIELGFTEALSRRIVGGQLVGADNKLAVDYVKMVNKIYQETGYDISRMLDVTDTGLDGERVLGEGLVHAQGKGAFRKIARVVAEDIVFKQLMGAPDVAFSSAHFADSVNLNSMRMAKGDKTKASEIMRDAMLLEPQTPEGLSLRAQGILDAQTATWTNKTWASQMSQNLRKVFNDATGDARLGDLLFPFIKTPANVISTGMDYAGFGIPKALVKTFNAFRAGELGNKEVLQGITRDLTRAGLGLVGAVMISGLLDDEDFVGAYDPARVQIEQLRNSNYNSIRLGNKWISTDWLGPLAIPVTSIMYARKYGKQGWGERVFQYSKGVGSSILNLPVVSDIYDYVKGVAFKKNQTFDEMSGSTLDYITSQLYSRIVPSFLSDLAKATDDKERVAGKGIESIKAKIPGLRQTLPEKKNIFGEEMMTEPAWSTIMFGSRVKTNKETELIKEINRVSNETDKSITFTDWSKSSSKTLSQFKEKVGEEKFEEAKVKYGQELKKLLEQTVNSSKYKKANDDEKIKEINGLDLDAQNKILKQYNFKYKK